MATHTVVAVAVPAGVTVCTADGSPYRAGPEGVVHVNSAHVTELAARGYTSMTAVQMAAAGKRGVPLSLVIEV